jgi:hypothetical protein
MIDLPRIESGFSPGEHAERDAEDDGDDQRHEGEFQRRRQPLQDDLHRRLPVDEGAAEIALQEIAEIDEELLPQRPVEAEPLHGGVDLALRGLGIDQDVDRVADGIDADEDQDRHHDDGDQALAQPAQEIDEHGAAQPEG